MRNASFWLSIKKTAILVSVSILGLVILSPIARANSSGYRYYGERGDSYNTAMEQRDLIDRVYATDAGWDWEPSCPGDSHWSWNDCRCEGGTGNHHHDHHRHNHRHHHD